MPISCAGLSGGEWGGERWGGVGWKEEIYPTKCLFEVVVTYKPIHSHPPTFFLDKDEGSRGLMSFWGLASTRRSPTKIDAHAYASSHYL